MSVLPEGLYCAPGNVFIDPMKPVAHAIVTHGHADHARWGHGTVYATPETLDIMESRYGVDFCNKRVPLAYGEVMQLNKLELSMAPAGHILGSAQAILDHGNRRVVVSGDYKRRADPTCLPFTPVKCDVFISEATFGLPVFAHPPIEHELQKLLDSLALFPDRCHLIGAYSLGKCQRVMLGLRALGYTKPLYLHGAMVRLVELYQRHGFDFGEVIPVSTIDKKTLAGEVVLAPPSTLNDRWSRNLPNVVTCLASGWMQIRAHAKQKLVELPLIISDHADWPELLQTLDDVGAPELWVTHGREDALVYQAEQQGIKARALSLLGYDDADADSD